MIVRASVVAAAESRVPPAIIPVDSPEADSIADAGSIAMERLLESPSMTSAPTAATATIEEQPGEERPGFLSAAVVTKSNVMARRTANLSFAGAKPSTTEIERLLGNNDLVDEFYLQRALLAAQPVMRIILRDASGRELGWATGFMVSPRLLLTNWHVFPAQGEAENALAEAHYVLDIAGNPAPSYRFAVRGDQFYSANQSLDFCLVAVEPVALDGRTPLSQFGYHRLIAEPHKISEGESMTIIQHPGGERRQFAIRENELITILPQFLWYQSDTAQGSSGAPAFNDSFQVVALHHSGAARRDANGNYKLRDGRTVTSIEDIDDSLVDWIANEGLRISVLCAFLRANLHPEDPLVRQLFQAMQGGDVMSHAIGNNGFDSFMAPVRTGEHIVSPVPAVGGTSLTIPLQLQVSLVLGETASVQAPRETGQSVAATVGAVTPDAATTAAPMPPGVEALRYPYVDRDYAGRTGYDVDFLGVSAPLPTIADMSLVAKMADGESVIPYEHFSVVLHKQRRLPLYTAANMDYSLLQRRPEPGVYSRDALGGLKENDQEKWFTDPRVPAQYQLPDVFYTKDGGYFDKGHVVRREDVCWGDSRDQIRRANGDTFHVTNCTTQIAGFNRSMNGQDNWGDLENEIQKQAKTEKLSVLAGAILAENDKLFHGRDDFGPVSIQIPREYWKVVLANDSGALAVYAFVLQQELHNLPEEFRVTATWKPFQVSLSNLQGRLNSLSFPSELHNADQHPA